MSEYVYHYLIVHLVCGAIGISTKLLNEKYIKVSDILWAFLFGLLYMFSQFHSLNTVLIDLRKK